MTDTESNFLYNNNRQNQEYLAKQLFLGENNLSFGSRFTYGLLYKLLDHGQVKLNSIALDTLGQLLGLPVHKTMKIDPIKVAQLLKVWNFFLMFVFSIFFLFE